HHPVAFITKFDPSGALVYSTWLGGSGYSIASGIAIDAAGDVYVTGGTGSVDFPTTANALQRQPGIDLLYGIGGGGFVSELNAAGTALVYSTYLDSGSPAGIAVDDTGSAYIVGTTSAQVSKAFVAKLNPGGTALVYLKYLGGSGNGPGYL